MVSKKGKRKLLFRGREFYWYIKADETGYPYVTVFTDNKKLRLTARLIDREAIGGPSDAVELLEAHFGACEPS